MPHRRVASSAWRVVGDNRYSCSSGNVDTGPSQPAFSMPVSEVVLPRQ